MSVASVTVLCTANKTGAVMLCGFCSSCPMLHLTAVRWQLRKFFFHCFYVHALICCFKSAK